MKKMLILFLVIAVCQAVEAGSVSLGSLLDEMVDRSRIAEFPEPGFTCKQFSSYDRDSVSPEKSGWFANWDRSQFIRTEEFQGRTEQVLMDAKGPGAVVRFWGTWHGPGGGEFSNGTLRIYLDNNPVPAVVGPIMDILSGGKLVGEPLSRSLSPTTRMQWRAHNLYLPIPYAKHCKITYETDVLIDRGAKKGEAIYYQINYRTYPDGTNIETFTMDRLAKAQPLLDRIQAELAGVQSQSTSDLPKSQLEETLRAGQSQSVQVKGPGAISELNFNLQAEDLEQALRSTVLEIHFDGHQTVWCPIGDFFGTGHKINPYRTWYTKVTTDGTMICYWVMPFEKKAQVTVHNYGDQQVNIKAQVQTSPWRWDKRSMYFHANWKNYNHVKIGGGVGMTGNAAMDLNYIEIQGQGVYAGDTLTIFNRAASWWGEGDEKIYVDGEAFPSHFGTGTEDYYGYAWCRPEFFEAPFHAQPNGSGNMNGGFSVNSRYRALDGIPFTKSLKFDMELWHWATTEIDYAPTTFWYAFKGATANGELSPEKALEKVGRLRHIIEGETAQLRKVTGGFTEVQSGDWGASGGKHLWWKNGSVGDELAIAIQVGQTGDYEVTAQMITAADYGRFRISLDGAELAAAEDFYMPQGVHVKPLDAGHLHLEKGEHVLSFTILEKNPAAKPGNLLGVDCIKLTKID